MSNEKHYPLHPGQTQPPPYYMQVPTEEYEALKREVQQLRELTAGNRTTIDDVVEINTLTSEVKALREMNAKAQEEIADMKKACKDKDDWCLHTLKENRHYKYKWCLAMADKCVDLCHKSKDMYRWAEDENLEHHYNRKIEFFARWHLRWLAIAEKFKEYK